MLKYFLKIARFDTKISPFPAISVRFFSPVYFFYNIPCKLLRFAVISGIMEKIILIEE